jgi:hypothetical protein
MTTESRSQREVGRPTKYKHRSPGRNKTERDRLTDIIISHALSWFLLDREKERKRE